MQRSAARCRLTRTPATDEAQEWQPTYAGNEGRGPSPCGAVRGANSASSSEPIIRQRRAVFLSQEAGPRLHMRPGLFPGVQFVIQGRAAAPLPCPGKLASSPTACYSAGRLGQFIEVTLATACLGGCAGGRLNKCSAAAAKK